MRIKFLPALMASLCISTTCVMTSCLDNDDVPEYIPSSNSSITSFSLGTLKVKGIAKDKDGKDSIYYDDIDMSKYPFTIDQIRRTIENKDSLPVGTDISRVLTKISADTQYILYGKINKEGEEPKDTLWTEQDSINFAIAPKHTLMFKVGAMSGVMGKPYSIKLNVHNLVPDSLQWASYTVENRFNAGPLTQQRALHLDNWIFVFGKNEGKTHVEYTQLIPVETTTDNKTVVADVKTDKWTQLNDANGIVNTAEPYSAMVWKEQIYFLSKGKVYCIDPKTKEVTEAEEYNRQELNFNQLISGVTTPSGSDLLYARTQDGFLTYSNGQWGKTENSQIEYAKPGSRTATANLPVSYNKNLIRTVVMSYRDKENSPYGTVSHRINNDTEWTSYQYEQADTFTCPNIVDPSMIYYNKKLYAFGGEITSKPHDKFKEPFSTFFCSSDNGLSWKPISRNVCFPSDRSFADLYGAGIAGEGAYSCTIDNYQFIWIIWSDGRMSHGRINHLGFAPKW